LGADAENARLKAAQDGILPEVVSNLLVGISDETDENLLREKLGRAPVK
jgi:hypothetical protein